jgi:5-methylcytosine-specific restriction enzyme B
LIHLGLIFFAHNFSGLNQFDAEQFVKELNNTFTNIWRCATSNRWDAFSNKSVLTIAWLNPGIDYKNTKEYGPGKTSVRKWVEELKKGDLIIVMDKYKYYGIAIAKTQYEYSSNDIEFDEEYFPVINVEFIHCLNTPVNHNFNIQSPNPASFSYLKSLGFSETDTFSFISKKFPEVISSLRTYMNKNIVTPASIDGSNLKQSLSMNTILYGPPGTGKTFHSISHSVAIVENISVESILAEERELIKSRFDQYVNDGQIVFCTFHQSLSYEDFIEGIKPIEPGSEDEALTYAVEDGIFKRICTEAAFSFIQKNTTTETEKVLDFSTEYDRFVDTVNERFSKGEITELETRSGGNVYIESISQKNNIWVRHIDGNRSYTVSKKRLSKISQAFPELSKVTNINDQFRDEIGGSNSSAYWAVLNAIRKQPRSAISKDTKTYSEKEYSYEDKKEIIKSLKYDDYKIDNPKKFVLIIDEVNRGNVSQIFGELITLIEEDKRLGKEEALKATLPYSKDKFGVPCNISIIGTMNTADRSVEALDTALRRRFSFIPMAPKPSELEITSDDLNLPEILRVLNTRLSVLKDYDHTIGHAWLWNVTDISSLKIVFKDKILPLLQEYFYNDYEKLGLVLGDAFFKPHVQVESNLFASFSGGNGLAGQYDQTWQYQLKSADELTVADFKTLEQLKITPVKDEE